VARYLAHDLQKTRPRHHSLAQGSLSTGHPAKTSVTAVHDRLPGFASCSFNVGTIGRSILTVHLEDLGFIQRAVQYALCVLRSRVRELLPHGLGTRDYVA
jgi:hypothetical protein